MRANRIQALRVLSLALVVLLAAAPVVAAQMSRVIEGSVRSEMPPMQAWFSNSPDPKTTSHAVIIPAGEEVRVFFHVAARGALDETVTFRADRGSLNLTKENVTAAAGSVTTIPLLYTPDSSHAAIVSASFSHSKDLDVQTGFVAVVPISAAFTSPRSERVVVAGIERIVPAQTSWDEPLDIKVRFTNHASRATESFSVGLGISGRSVGDAEVPRLDPGESREIVMKRFRLADDDPYAQRMRGSMQQHQIQFMLHVGGEEGGRGGAMLYDFEFEDNVLSNYTPALLDVVFRTGLLARVVGQHLELAKPSWVAVELENLDKEVARDVKVDILVHPVPGAYFGENTLLRKSLRVTVAGEGTEVVNVSFTPRVAADYLVSVHAPAGPYTPPMTSAVSLRGDLVVRPEWERSDAFRVGETNRVTLVFDSAELAGAAEVGLAIANPYETDEIPYERFISRSDVVRVEGSKLAHFTPGEPTTVVLDVTPRAVGMFLLVPYVRIGDVIHVAYAATGGEDAPEAPVWRGLEMHEFPADMVLLMEVQPASVSVLGLLWMPLGVVVVGFAGYWTYRWRFVT